jgi:hypothetical protein
MATEEESEAEGIHSARAHNPLTSSFKLFFHCKIKPTKISLHTLLKKSLSSKTKHDVGRHMRTSLESLKSEVPPDRQNT